MLLDIKPLTFLVNFQNYPGLVMDTFFAQKSLSDRIKVLIKILLFTRMASNEHKKLYQDYSRRVDSLSWVKYGSDGTRVHLYDNKNSTIGKLPKVFNPEQYSYELEARQRVGDLCPKIINTCSEDGYILESKISLHSYDKSLTKALELLKERLFAPNLLNISEYLSRFDHVKHSRLVCEVAINYGLNEVVVSICHGDFWRGNILESPDNNIVILDWEYCGVRIQTYDAWFLIFSQWAAEKRHCDSEYYSQLQEILNKFYVSDSDLTRIKVLHMIHLFERFSTNLFFGKSSDEPEMKFLETELISVTKELSL